MGWGWRGGGKRGEEEEEEDEEEVEDEWVEGKTKNTHLLFTFICSNTF